MPAKKALWLLLGLSVACGGKPTAFHSKALADVLVLDPSQFPGDDIGAQVNAACASANGQPAQVVIAAGSYCLQTQINPPSQCSISGAGSSATSLNANYAGCTQLGNNAVIGVRGNAATHVTDIRISDLALTNGTPSSSGAAGGRDGIRADYCDRCVFQSLYVHSIAGYFAIVWKHSTTIVASDNRVEDFYSGGITALTGSQYEWIENNQVKGAVNRTGDNGLAYGIGAAGYEDVAGQTGPFTRHAWITNNVVSDIPTWECYDTHGGYDQHFVGNQGSGCYFGLQAGTVVNQASADGLDTLEIAGNHFTRCDARANGYGIVLAGAGLANPVTNATVTQNVVSGYGSAESTQIGAITLMSTRATQITYNQIPAYYQSAILFYANNWNATVTGNVGGDLWGSKFPQYRCLIALDSIGNWGLRVDNNSSMPTSSDSAPFSLLCDGNKANHISVGPNNSFTVPCGPPHFWGNEFLPLCLAQLPSSSSPWPLNFVPGDIGYTPDYQPMFVFSAPASGYYSMDTTSTIATGDLDAGSMTIGNLGGGLGGGFWYYWFPSGMNITVDGAGAAGAALDAQVVANDGTQLILDTAAATTVRGATIRWQGGAVSLLGKP
jgi:hypothetical protein